MAFKVLIPQSMTDDPIAVEGAEYFRYDMEQPFPEEHRNADALVVWGANPEWIRSAREQLPNLRWVQTLAAGPDVVLNAGFAETVQITSGRSLHDLTVAEHTLAMMLAIVRRLPELFEAKQQSRWASEIGGLKPLHDPERITTLIDARVTIWGYGGIAKVLSGYLRSLGAKVTGVAQSERVEDGVQVYATETLERLLPETDLLVMILPHLPSTDKALDAAKLALLPQRSWLVNVGRGGTVDEEALIAALQRKQIAGAALDVTTVEPLPASSALWRLDNVIITPHAAGGRPIGAGELVAENLRRLLAGEPLKNLSN